MINLKKKLEETKNSQGNNRKDVPDKRVSVRDKLLIKGLYNWLILIYCSIHAKARVHWLIGSQDSQVTIKEKQ